MLCMKLVGKASTEIRRMGVVCVAAGIADSWLERRVIYLQSYGNNIKKLEDEVKKLEEARGRIKHLVDAEERNGYEILVGVRDWLILAEQVIDEANHVLEDPNHAKLGFSMCNFPNLRHRHRVSKEAFYTIGRVAYVLESGKFDRVGSYNNSSRNCKNIGDASSRGHNVPG
ncbi:disease resistance protein [Senna tora]|uniref:Disease resistance protein n=1 Tax=Senna tora TaxID=362788 RepID=A0A834XKJ1_9FABA|nr:disease resistance protein [Senna tora]